MGNGEWGMPAYIPYYPWLVAFIVGSEVVDVFRFVVNREAGTVRAVSPYLDHVGAGEGGEKEGTCEDDDGCRCRGEKTHSLEDGSWIFFFCVSVTFFGSEDDERERDE